MTPGGWRKSRRSIANGQCLEAGNFPGAVLVRDTTDREGPVPQFGAGAWREFLRQVKR